MTIVFFVFGMENRYPVDRKSGVHLRDRVADVVDADNQCQVGRLEFGVDSGKVPARVLRHAGLAHGFAKTPEKHVGRGPDHGGHDNYCGAVWDRSLERDRGSGR